jgi:putative oxidoreductase
MIASLTPLAGMSDIILLVVRLFMGVTMIYFGWRKVKDLRTNANDFVQMGFRPGWFWGTMVAIVEFVGGLAIIFGVLIWLAAAAMAIHTTAGTLWKISKAKKPFTDWSYDLLLLALALVLLTFGAGGYALFS